MRDRIYNADYPRADPGFAEARPAGFARALSGWLAPLKSRIASLDHGGGSGRLAALMRQAGFDYDTYDPYFAGSAAPRRRYDLVTSFEVVEHTPDPVATFTTMLSFLQPEGAVLFSTNLQPPLVTSDWWYIAPRNGHVSIYTARSLRALAARLGVGFLTLGTHLHLLYRSAGDPVAGTLLRHDLFSVLWQASQQNARALAAATWTGLQLGRPFTALDPRHAARLLLGERKPAASR
jgi:2-polyprenyl-6-hydroxyphenyl methylase/3-demethylubiquinone-9 3-methyltransferase